MLVISRKANQTVVFPTLGIEIEIIRVASRSVKIGLSAPSEVRILRGELRHLVDEAPSSLANAESSTADQAKMKHDRLNQLNQANLALRLVQKQLATGDGSGAEKTLQIALSTFSLLEQQISSTRSPFAAADPQVASTSGQTGKKLALVVEDDPNERSLLAGYLRASGYQVDTVEDGRAALEYLSQRTPDAVVMDMEMPRLHGRETIAAIRANTKFDDLRLFVVSGSDQHETQVPVGERGIQRWFQKPLEPEDLVKELADSLN